MKIIRCLALGAAFLVTGAPLHSTSSAEAQLETRRYPIESFGVLELHVPADWRASVEPPSGVMPTIIVLEAPSTEKLLISVFPNARRDPDFATASRVRSMTEQDGLELLPTAVESELVLHELKGSSHTGYFYSFTDKSLVGKTPPPGEFQVLTQGHVGVGDFRLLFTILTNDKTSPAREQALRTLRTATQHTPA